MKRHFNYQLMTFVALFSVTMILTTCKKGEEPPSPNDVIIAKEVKVINNQTWEDQFISLDSTNYTITFSKNITTTQQIKVGDIIVSAVGEGLLRKVKSVSTVNNEIKVQTVPATLTEVIQQGLIEFDQPLTVSQIKSIDYHYAGVKLNTDDVKGMEQTLFNWDINTVLYDDDGNLATTSDQIKLIGTFNCDWRIALRIDIGLIEGLKEVKFGFESGENLDLQLVAGIQYNFEKKVTLATVNFTPIVVTIGTIPVVFTPQLKIIAGIDGSANASVTSNITQSLSFDAGIKYLKAEGWSPYKTFDKNISFQPPQLNLNAGAEVYLKPELSIKIYAIAGPYANLKLYSRLDADLLQTPWWKLYGGITMNAGAKVEILDKFLLEYTVSDLLNYEILLAQATTPPVSLPTVTTNSVASITQTTATGGGNVTSDGNSTVTVRGVCWSTSQNPTTSNNVTTNGSGTGSFTSNLPGLTPNTNYYVKAYATNSAGTAYGNQVPFTTLGYPPIAAFTALPTTVTMGQSVQFTDQSTNTPTSWSWNFGDGTTSTSQNPAHTYSTAGTYTVTLKATNNFGNNTVTKTGYITVNPVGIAPVAAFTASQTTITAGGTVNFTDQSTNTPTSWSWNFGDGGTSTSKNPSHTYNTAGTYTVSLTATNNFGSDSETKSNYITVNTTGVAPIVAFTASPTTILVGGTVNFTDQSTNTPTSWSWSFGDGGTSTSKDPSHTYNAEGTYTVSLTATNNFGFNSLNKSNYIAVTNLPTLTTTAISGITQTSASSGGNVTSEGSASVTARGVCWSTTSNPTTANTKTTDGSGTSSFTSSITGLTANTTYYVRAYATNSVGTAYGTQVSFTTSSGGQTGTVTDTEGNTYSTITIGTQTWMAENLMTTKYNDGTAISNVTNNTTWSSLTTGAYCWYNNNAATSYGALYNWYTVNTGKLCPTGWHVPGDAEWTTLTTYLGGESVAGGKLKETGTSHWSSPNTGATNSSGFAALPGGDRYIDGGYSYIGSYGGWWSSTEYSTTSAWYRDMDYRYAYVSRYDYYKQVGFSVRCLRD